MALHHAVTAYQVAMVAIGSYRCQMSWSAREAVSFFVVYVLVSDVDMNVQTIVTRVIVCGNPMNGSRGPP